MPAIRDFASNFTTVTTGTTIIIPVPAVEENDLMVAVLVADTGTGTWSSTDWSELFRQTNTSQLCVMYKIASSSEPDDYTFTRSTNETFNGRIITIRDVDTTNPFGSTPTYTATNQAAAAKYTLPQVTTTVANSLVLYAVSNAVAAVPSIIEGPVSLIVGEDGNSESGGVGWTFMPSTGASPNNVTCSNVGSGAGVKAAIQIAAPSGGATVVPTYCAADASIYINPIHGTTAYNSDGGLAANWDTLIGTSLNSITLADATVAAAADVGINPYHSAGRLTSISGSRNWAGATLDLAAGNNVDISGLNVLIHTGPSTPGQIQRYGAAASRKGTAIAMMSSTGNWKAWHVHGKGTPYGYQRDVPLIINSGNTTGLLQSAGTLDASAVDVFGFAIAGGGVTTTIWDFYSLWALDTITVCGGNSNNPIDVPGIVLASADGHERKSVVQQGTAQAIIFQPIQIGDGGTHPTYLDLNATAIEFPRQYDLTKLQVNYCSVDNIAGITYYAGSSDTIKHRNSVISSPSKYHWGFHASTSSSATYDFAGLQVIGAGTVTLVNNLALSGISWSSCDGFASSGAYLDNCFIENSFSSTALTVSSATNMDRITNCTFTDNTNGHSIEITATGTYDFDNIIFSGGGAGGTTTADVYNNSGGLVTINILNGGSTPTIRNGAGATTNVVVSVNVSVHVEDTAGADIAGAQVFIRKSGAYYNYTSHNTNNAAGDATFEVNETVDTDLPQIGWLHVWDANTNTKQEYRYVSWSGTVFTLNTQVTGSATSTGSSTSLISTSTNFLTADIEEGDTIRNTTDGSWAVVDEIVDADNITTTALVGGSDNTWQSGDSFSLHRLALTYDNTDLVDIPIFNGQTDSNGDIATTFGGTTPASVVVRARSNQGATKYIPYNTSGTITSSGYSLTVVLSEDTVAT